MMQKLCTKRVNIILFGCWISLQNVKTLFFLTIYTYNKNVINLLPHLVEAYTAKCIRCIKTLALSLLRPEAILAFQASFLSLCFLEQVALTLGKISPVWLILQLWNFADMFSIKLPKWCQSVFFISKKVCIFWTYASQKSLFFTISTIETHKYRKLFKLSKIGSDII